VSDELERIYVEVVISSSKYFRRNFEENCGNAYSELRCPD
jgi:hypothetical protein